MALVSGKNSKTQTKIRLRTSNGTMLSGLTCTIQTLRSSEEFKEREASRGLN